MTFLVIFVSADRNCKLAALAKRETQLIASKSLHRRVSRFLLPTFFATEFLLTHSQLLIKTAQECWVYRGTVGQKSDHDECVFFLQFRVPFLFSPVVLHTQKKKQIGEQNMKPGMANISIPAVLLRLSTNQYCILRRKPSLLLHHPALEPLFYKDLEIGA